jgi:hypothetical protein
MLDGVRTTQQKKPNVKTGQLLQDGAGVQMTSTQKLNVIRFEQLIADLNATVSSGYTCSGAKRRRLASGAAAVKRDGRGQTVGCEGADEHRVNRTISVAGQAEAEIAGSGAHILTVGHVGQRSDHGGLLQTRRQRSSTQFDRDELAGQQMRVLGL